MQLLIMNKDQEIAELRATVEKLQKDADLFKQSSTTSST